MATSLLGPMPIEQLSPVRSAIAALTRRAAARGRSIPVRSRYASSSPTTSTRSTCSRSTSMTSRERARYSWKSGGMKMTSGQRRRAHAAGVAE